MTGTILIVGKKNIASALNVGTRQLEAWADDPEVNLPIKKQGAQGRWIATAENLRSWANRYFAEQRQ